MTSRQQRRGQDGFGRSKGGVATGRTWHREEDKLWAGRFRLRLVMRHDPPEGLADQVLDEVYEAVTDSGAPAHELFGDADDFAAQVAAERIDEAHRSCRGIDGTTPGEGFIGGLLVLGAIGVMLSVTGWVRGGSEFAVDWRALAATVLIGMVALLTTVALALRTAGRTRGWWTVCAAGVVTVAVIGLTIGSLPEGPLFSVPAPVVVVLSALPAVIALLLPEERVSRWFIGPQAAPEDGPEAQRGGNEAWLGRLDGVLRGAYGMPPATARGHVEEAREHLAASGGAAGEEFGRPREYAQRLAGGPAAPRRAARRKLLSGLLFALLVVALLWDVAGDPDPGSFTTWLLPPAALVWAWSLWGHYRETRAS
ncbi:hypothetical protein [Streptomyces sp. NPDC058045]|uniref:hypothetical protein n=1 Tax=Streptomyces sp. NPDC058045 TaxID=3346311 RepID=UPI0036EB7981